ncbi:possible glutaredoxin [Rhodococcus jostii RHA1]|uniref:Possible glutaredoxin n=1 Tax=Rhodococcus jostii (strain RHA1) TaxID=101510 RepID=Q0S2S9_RHOJR|nr:mycoredoxin [Rhodococcus jostii]ABG98157.1 possible glutaredoxin [Rhodococcus jostii RHA1]
MTATDTPALTIYSTTWCGYCRRLKTQLDESGIGYLEIDIEDDPASAEFVGSVNGGNHVVPTVKFADGSTATNPSLAQVKQLLGA